MPTSKAHMIPSVAMLYMQQRPQTTLEVGVGFGKYGVLFREWGDARFGRVNQKDWQTKIHGVEIFGDYANPAWGVYDRVTIMDARRISTDSRYDFVFVGDMLEHLPKSEGAELLDKLKKVSNKCLAVVVPLGHQPQGALFGNEAEQHVSDWDASDFDGWSATILDGKGLFYITK
jgi:hypothetical protein